MPAQERPRERLIKYGASALSNSELLAIILRTGSAKENVLSLANRILSEFDLKQLSRASVARLKSLHGIKEAKAAEIAACFELARRLESFTESPKPAIRGPQDVFNLKYPLLRELKKEVFLALHLNTKNYLIKEETISIGSLNENVVHPREVFKSALMESASALIVVHNHPSGDPTPSNNDVEITKKLDETGKIIGIPLLDHIIIGDGRYVSLKDRGVIRSD